MAFDRGILATDDYYLVDHIIGRDRGGVFKQPDLTIEDENQKPYLYRWHLVRPPERVGGMYLHVQVGDDPQRPLHDHPWDNTSIILRNGYDELWSPSPATLHRRAPITRLLRNGDMVTRKAEEAHRLLLPKKFPYTITLFAIGPVRRPWGFWFNDGWRNSHDVIDYNENTHSSVMTPEAIHDFEAQRSL